MEKNKIEIRTTKLQDSYEIIIINHGDRRGGFEEYFKDSNYAGIPFNGVRQCNRSYSKKDVFRGFHYQMDNNQAKIVEVLEGSALAIIIDIREGSPTYGQYEIHLLSPEKKNQLFVPHGFANGFIALEDNTVYQYLCDDVYNPLSEGGIIYNDPDIGIDWDAIKKEYGIEELILSDKDQKHPTLKETKFKFYYGEKPENVKKYLITGFNGQLGYDVKRELISRGVPEENILATDIDTMDITKKADVIHTVNSFKPDVIFHCAAWTNVDGAEKDMMGCCNANVIGTRNIVDASLIVDAKIIYLSTDYVFDGEKTGLYNEQDAPNPKNIYGLTKYLGELEVSRNPKHFISRISWVFGINGKNFVKSMVNTSQKRLEEGLDYINVVDDQIGSPTYTVHLAKTLADMANATNYGTYHVTNKGYCSWAEFAEKIFEVFGIDIKVNRVTTEEFFKGKEHAVRPENSCFDETKAITSGYSLPTIEEALKEYKKELKLNEKK